MNKKTLKITQGAMMVAIFGMLLLMNRQTAGLFEGVMFFLLPIPLVAYSAMYGWKPGMSVFVAMALVSGLFGTIMTMFYAITQCLVGLVFGSMMFKKVESTKVLGVVMVMSALSSVLELLFTAALFGYSMMNDVNEMGSVMEEAFAKAGMPVPEKFLNTNFLSQMFVISTIFWGLVTGFVIFELSLIILKRLKFPVQKPKSVFCYYPPKLLGAFCFVVYMFYNFSLANSLENVLLQNTLQVLGLCGYLYLVVFGIMAVLLWTRKKFPTVKAVGIVLSFLAIFVLPQFLMFLGFFYASGSLHESMMEGMKFD